mgnify:CR=1 FL=1
MFIDGDRGGKLIANNVIDHAEVKYVAVAPEGKEVEELAGKEILQSLRARISIKEYLFSNGWKGKSFDSENAEKVEVKYSGNVKEKLRQVYKKLDGDKGAFLLNDELDVIKKVSPKEIISNVKSSRTKVAAIVLEGNATASLITFCDEVGISYLAATNFSHVAGAKVELVSL